MTTGPRSHGADGLAPALEAGAPVRESLAAALGDPSLEVAYWLVGTRRIGGEGWVDGDGRAVPDPAPSAARGVRLVEHRGERVAALTYDATIEGAAGRVEAVATEAAIALQNVQLQAMLHAEVAFLDTVADTAPSLLLNVGPDGRIRHINAAAVEASGYDDREDVRGRSFCEIYAGPAERDATAARLQAVAAGGPDGEIETTFADRRGEVRTILWQAGPLRDDAGGVVSVVVGGVDVTARKRREEEVRAGEERFRAVVDSAPVAIVEITKDHNVNLWNPAAERIFGWSADEVLGRPPPTIPPGREAEFVRLTEVESRGEAYTGFETVRLHRDGHELDVEISAAPIRDQSGEVIGAMAVLSDITERKLHEEELRASRARLVAAADEERKRLERDLHDGAQQRLVALSLSLRLAEARLGTDPGAAAPLLASAREELALALEELREIARGIHPALLTDRGLGPAVEALADRAPVPVEVEVPGERFPAPVEVACYYLVAEALTNVAKYAAASSASVRVRVEHERLVVEVRDDGTGGADPARGSGLRGLADRVAALDGALAVESPPAGGTWVRAEIPLDGR